MAPHAVNVYGAPMEITPQVIFHGAPSMVGTAPASQFLGVLS